MKRLKAWGSPHRTAVGRLLAAAAWTATAAIAAGLTLIFAATLMVVAVAASVFLAVAVALRGRRIRVGDPNLIEAHHVGGHSWVASGWDGRS